MTLALLSGAYNYSIDIILATPHPDNTNSLDQHMSGTLCRRR